MTGGIVDSGIEVTPLHMRKALGRFASGVTIVTTAESEEKTAVHGMTANAFASVSLDPPLVSVSIANGARMNEKISATSRYGISISRRRSTVLVLALRRCGE